MIYCFIKRFHNQNVFNESGLKSQIFFQEKPYIIDIQINNKFTKNYTIFYQSAN